MLTSHKSLNRIINKMMQPLDFLIIKDVMREQFWASNLLHLRFILPLPQSTDLLPEDLLR